MVRKTCDSRRFPQDYDRRYGEKAKEVHGMKLVAKAKVEQAKAFERLIEEHQSAVKLRNATLES